MKNKITGMMVYYYFVCKRKLWYFCNDITMEQYNDDVAMGKLIDDSSYGRENKHINIDGTISIDFLKGSDVLHEVKKSKAVEEASIWQVKYYLYYLHKRDVSIKKGMIDYPLLKKRLDVELSDEDILELEKIIQEIENIINNDNVPKLEKKNICKKCAYYAICYI